MIQPLASHTGSGTTRILSMEVSDWPTQLSLDKQGFPTQSNISERYKYGLGQPDAPEVILHSELGNRERLNAETEIIPTSVNLAQHHQTRVAMFHGHKRLSCNSYCSCICHSHQQYDSSGIFNKLLGSLYVRYTGLPVTVFKCDSGTCLNQLPRHFQASYTLPAWSVRKTLSIVWSLSVSGPSFELRVQNRVHERTSNAVILAHHGDTQGIIELLGKRKASLTDVSHRLGISSFRVGFHISELIRSLYANS